MSASQKPTGYVPSVISIMPPRRAVIVCEPQPYWTPELQRQFQQDSVAVRGCRKWSEIAPQSGEFDQTVEVVELVEDRAAECLTGLLQRQRVGKSPPLIIVTSPRLATLENVLREAGVRAFFPDQPTGEDLARCCRRWLNADRF